MISKEPKQSGCVGKAEAGGWKGERTRRKIREATWGDVGGIQSADINRKRQKGNEQKRKQRPRG